MLKPLLHGHKGSCGTHAFMSSAPFATPHGFGLHCFNNKVYQKKTAHIPTENPVQGNIWTKSPSRHKFKHAIPARSPILGIQGLREHSPKQVSLFILPLYAERQFVCDFRSTPSPFVEVFPSAHTGKIQERDFTMDPSTGAVGGQ